MADTLSVYFPERTKGIKKRLDRLAKKLDRSVNYLVVQAVKQYLEQEEQK